MKGTECFVSLETSVAKTEEYAVVGNIISDATDEVLLKPMSL